MFSIFTNVLFLYLKGRKATCSGHFLGLMSKGPSHVPIFFFFPVNVSCIKLIIYWPKEPRRRERNFPLPDTSNVAKNHCHFTAYKMG